ncbi:NADPH:quinone reductase-like Zn-dependent oxidoreductase [Bradyrhizobium sp. AZCC 2262]
MRLRVRLANREGHKLVERHAILRIDVEQGGRCRRQAGDVAFVHAAAGGVGHLLTQIIKLRGGQVIGRVSSEDKVAAAEEAGADHLIVDTEGHFAEEAPRLTGSGLAKYLGQRQVLVRMLSEH